MFSIITFIVLCLLVGGLLTLKNKDSGIAIILAVFIALMGSMFVGLLVRADSGLFPTEYTLMSQYNLRAAENSSSIDGRFFLGSGHISEFEKVGYFYEISPKQYQHGEVAIDEKVFFATDLETGETPRIELYKTSFTEDWMRNWGLEENTTSKVIFHVSDDNIASYLTFTP